MEPNWTFVAGGVCPYHRKVLAVHDDGRYGECVECEYGFRFSSETTYRGGDPRVDIYQIGSRPLPNSLPTTGVDLHLHQRTN